jgi:SAM-dependent methyltransferase
MPADPPIQKNRSHWNASSVEYQRAHGPTLEQRPLAWGVWRIPESQLGVLGEVRGRDVLEFGCGAAQWTLALQRSGTRAVGVDLSEEQLAHARRRSREPLRLVQANAEELPFRSESFDVVFCDHGATSWARPNRTIAEASRVLRTGGILAFCMSSPILDVCWDPATGRTSPRLVGDYFTLSELEDEDSICYQLPYGDWIRLFRRHSLCVEDLIELKPPVNATTTYDYVPIEWARRWPAENIWKLSKAR